MSQRRASSARRSSHARRGALAATFVLALSGAAFAQEAARGPLEWLGLATRVPEAQDFVRESRPDPETLEFMSIGTRRAEPPTAPATAAQILERRAAGDAIKPSRNALAASRPTPGAVPRLPQSALAAKAAYDAQMRERARRAD